jgi:hypothetical protein
LLRVTEQVPINAVTGEVESWYGTGPIMQLTGTLAVFGDKIPTMKEFSACFGLSAYIQPDVIHRFHGGAALVFLNQRAG